MWKKTFVARTHKTIFPVTIVQDLMELSVVVKKIIRNRATVSPAINPIFHFKLNLNKLLYNFNLKEYNIFFISISQFYFC